MDPRFARLLRERLEGGAVTIEVLVVEGEAPVAAGTRWALDPGGAVLAGPELPEGLRAALDSALGSLGPARRSARVRLEDPRARLYLERWTPPPRVVVFGGGHVGKALCAALRDLEFRVVVVEDRAYFADARRFDGEVEVVCAPFDQGASAAAVDTEDSVVIATRGHTEDLTCLRGALARRPFYLGLLGSRRKMREFARLLEGEGVAPSALEQVRCPVGLGIGAETPEEIAVAVAAELLAAHRGALPAG